MLRVASWRRQRCFACFALLGGGARASGTPDGQFAAAKDDDQQRNRACLLFGGGEREVWTEVFLVIIVLRN